MPVVPWLGALMVCEVFGLRNFAKRNFYGNRPCGPKDRWGDHVCHSNTLTFGSSTPLHYERRSKDLPSFPHPATRRGGSLIWLPAGLASSQTEKFRLPVR